MKTLAVIGSPRRGGNTDLLVAEVLGGCTSRGHASEKVRLYDVEVEACLDCRRCKARRGTTPAPWRTGCGICTRSSRRPT